VIESKLKNEDSEEGEDELEEDRINEYIKENQEEIYKVKHNIEEVEIEHRGRKKSGKEIVGTEQESDEDGDFMGDLDSDTLHLEDNKEDITHKDLHLLESLDNKVADTNTQEVNEEEANAVKVEDAYEESENDSKLQEKVKPIKEDDSSKIQYRKEKHVGVPIEFNSRSGKLDNDQRLFNETAKEPPEKIKDELEKEQEEVIQESVENINEEPRERTEGKIEKETQRESVEGGAMEEQKEKNNNANMENALYNPALSEYTETLKEEPSDNQRTKEELISSARKYLQSKARSEEESIKGSQHWSELIKEKLEAATSKKLVKEETNKEQSIINRANSEYSIGEDTVKDYSQLLKFSNMNILLGKYNNLSNNLPRAKTKPRISIFPGKYYKQ